MEVCSESEILDRCGERLSWNESVSFICDLFSLDNKTASSVLCNMIGEGRYTHIDEVVFSKISYNDDWVLLCKYATSVPTDDPHYSKRCFFEGNPVPLFLPDFIDVFNEKMVSVDDAILILNYLFFDLFDEESDSLIKMLHSLAGYENGTIYFDIDEQSICCSYISGGEEDVEYSGFNFSVGREDLSVEFCDYSKFIPKAVSFSPSTLIAEIAQSVAVVQDDDEFDAAFAEWKDE